MDYDYRSRIVIVTGGTGGLGKAVTGAFLQAGAQVVVPYRHEGNFRELSESVGVTSKRLMGIHADVTEERGVQKLVDATLQSYGRIDVLVNLVGGYTGGKVVETTVEAWDDVMSLNLKSTFLCCRAVLPHMISQSYGKIVNVASRTALKGAAVIASYSAAKAGVIKLTEALGEEVKAHNINVNVILPSIIDTEENRKSMPKADFTNWVKPEDIARVILFLASEDAKIINAASIPVYGKA